MVVPAAPRILVVEDQAINRDLVTMVLRKLHYEVDAVATAQAALACLAATPYALVLLDRSLPDMDGLELARRLRARRGPEAGVPVVLLDDAEGDPLDGPDAPAQGRLAKPLQIDRLLRIVRSLTRDPKRPPREGAGQPVIDVDHLNAFTDGDAQLERELAALFLSTAAVYLERMRKALESGGEDWAAAAHALKGASGNLGARRVAALALSAERAGPDGEALEQLRHAVDEVREALERRTGLRC